MTEVIELTTTPAREVLEVTITERETIVDVARQGPPGPPGPAGSDVFDIDLNLIYQIAKL
ncbi:hypothetical protein DLM_2076 [Aquitalea magnusonii]|uniref:Uncharacterized protein n=1 Tax=Aquitalea magnusonii TaxID=332411 RepID=A0A3G9GHF5_9NEIS|nr:hypothetical protein [Aquitalea magnusonii]BBF85691.1 hypothetical protein DLM_2076 [Aquitalea magnusonii]